MFNNNNSNQNTERAWVNKRHRGIFWHFVPRPMNEMMADDANVEDADTRIWLNPDDTPLLSRFIYSIFKWPRQFLYLII